MVLAFFASRCAVVLPLLCFLLIGMFVEPQYLPGLIKLVFANAVTLAGILLGGGMFSGSTGSLGRTWNYCQLKSGLTARSGERKKEPH
jgi:hypothetical protein